MGETFDRVQKYLPDDDAWREGECFRDWYEEYKHSRDFPPGATGMDARNLGEIKASFDKWVERHEKSCDCRIVTSRNFLFFPECCQRIKVDPYRGNSFGFSP